MREQLLRPHCGFTGPFRRQDLVAVCELNSGKHVAHQRCQTAPLSPGKPTNRASPYLTLSDSRALYARQHGSCPWQSPRLQSQQHNKTAGPRQFDARLRAVGPFQPAHNTTYIPTHVMYMPTNCITSCFEFRPTPCGAPHERQFTDPALITSNCEPATANLHLDLLNLLSACHASTPIHVRLLRAGRSSRIPPWGSLKRPLDCPAVLCSVAPVLLLVASLFAVKLFLPCPCRATIPVSVQARHHLCASLHQQTVALQGNSTTLPLHRQTTHLPTPGVESLPDHIVALALTKNRPPRHKTRPQATRAAHDCMGTMPTIMLLIGRRGLTSAVLKPHHICHLSPRFPSAGQGM